MYVVTLTRVGKVVADGCVVRNEWVEYKNFERDCIEPEDSSNARPYGTDVHGASSKIYNAPRWRAVPTIVRCAIVLLDRMDPTA